MSQFQVQSEVQTSLDFDPDNFQKLSERNLTLEQLEVQTTTSNESGSIVDLDDDLEEEVLSLSSLIEGDVDALDSNEEEPELLAIQDVKSGAGCNGSDTDAGFLDSNDVKVKKNDLEILEKSPKSKGKDDFNGNNVVVHHHECIPKKFM